MNKITLIITGMMSTTAAILVVFGWLYLHPAPRMAKVDIIGIVGAQQKNLSAQIKPDMDAKAQTEIIESAARFGKQLDAALTQVSLECKCTLINAAAIIKDAPNGATPDYTLRVIELSQLRK